MGEGWGNAVWWLGGLGFFGGEQDVFRCLSMSFDVSHVCSVFGPSTSPLSGRIVGHLIGRMSCCRWGVRSLAATFARLTLAIL